MIISKLQDMKAGWFIGNFEPACLRTEDCEVARKGYRAGDTETRHVHRVATEITLIISGRVKMNDHELKTGDIIRLGPGESTDFQALEDTVTVVVKLPSVMGDKYPE